MRTERIALVSASLATGAAVSLAGPVSFVGIIVPHLVRLIVGSDHRLVLPASALFGGAFLIGCDLVARTIIAPLELPVGIVTAMIGGRFFYGCCFESVIVGICALALNAFVGTTSFDSLVLSLSKDELAQDRHGSAPAIQRATTPAPQRIISLIPRQLRCCSRWAPATDWSASATTIDFRPR